MNTIIKVNNVSFNYGSGSVLSQISFSIARGDFAGLIGGNGTGKSTLIKLLLGRLTALNGNIEVFGKNINSFKDWNKIGYIPQKVTSFNSAYPIYVEELVALPLTKRWKGHRASKAELSQRVSHALETVGMLDFRKRRIGSLSGGQQQRVFIAKALVSEPELLLLDEPTVGVDQEAENDIYQLLDKLNHENGMTILWVSHDIAAISALTNRLLCIGPDGFFEHDYTKDGHDVDLQKLYGFEIMEHSHGHHHHSHYPESEHSHLSGKKHNHLSEDIVSHEEDRSKA